jgi:multidrug transporter EmrE-like cation transporter
MKTKLSAILMVLVADILTCSAQIFYKFAADRLVLTNIWSYLTNYPFIIGLILYASAGFMLIKALEKGEVTVLYPFFAATYVLVLLFSRFIFKETITPHKWIGVIAIMIGVTLISIGSKSKHPAIEYEVGAE